MAMMRRGVLAALAAMMGCLVLGAPGAFAAAPVNDEFGARLMLSDSLPIAVSSTNVGATRKEGEPFLVFGAGHTIWYEWEATSAGFVTVGTCGTTDFRAQAGVFTGTAVNALTEVANSAFTGGPGCSSGEGGQATFRAVEGTTYEIVVDGDGFYLPEWPKPVTEGAVTLQIEATPVPPNDAFANAAAVNGRIEEEPGEPPFYFGTATGYNWGATKELGEPEHAGDPGGASVWYEWTAPATGFARLSAQGNGFKTLLTIYAGDALDALTPLASGEFLGIEGVSVTAGTTYRIAVDGKRDSGSGEASTARFWLYVVMDDLPLPDTKTVNPLEAIPRAASDTTPPETTLLHGKLPKYPTTKFFAYKSSEYPSTFRCRLDARPFAGCGSSRSYRNLKSGRHKFEVFAVDVAGNKDPTPARVRFRIPKIEPVPPQVKG
jgi:hypothetical protein